LPRAKQKEGEATVREVEYTKPSALYLEKKGGARKYRFNSETIYGWKGLPSLRMIPRQPRDEKKGKGGKKGKKRAADRNPWLAAKLSCLRCCTEKKEQRGGGLDQKISNCELLRKKTDQKKGGGAPNMSHGLGPLKGELTSSSQEAAARVTPR